MDSFSFERAHSSLHPRIAGVDEAGRGPLAGPVTAAAVVLPSRWYTEGLPTALQGLDDSKKLSPARRERFFEALLSFPEIMHAIAVVDPQTIDRINILKASHLAMAQALQGLQPAASFALVDGLPVQGLSVEHHAIVQGDHLSSSIAAASILAKVTRDRIMLDLDTAHPGYGFAVHKGYPTRQHLAALARLGPSPVHRRSFAPVRAIQTELFER